MSLLCYVHSRWILIWILSLIILLVLYLYEVISDRLALFIGVVSTIVHMLFGRDEGFIGHCENEIQSNCARFAPVAQPVEEQPLTTKY